MIITLASFKGGVGKTTSAVHLGCYFSDRGSTLLVDGDPNKSAINWAKRGELPFKTVDLMAAPRQMKQFENIVIDTAARPTAEDLEALIDGCDLLILPTSPDALSMDALLQTIKTLKQLSSKSDKRYRVLLTMIPSAPRKTGQQAREALRENEVPLFKQSIRRFACYEKAALQGVPVYRVSDRNAGIAWKEYVAVGEEL